MALTWGAPGSRGYGGPIGDVQIANMAGEQIMALAVHMSPEIEQALGPQMAMRIRATTEGTCIECRQPLDDDQVNVVLWQSTVDGSGGIWLVHDRCAPSRIVPLTAEATAALVQPEDGYDMTMTAAIVDDTPVLIARLGMTPTTTSGIHGAEPRNLLMQELLASGFRLITNELDAPPLEQWDAVVQLHGRHLQLVVVNPAGQRFFHGTLAKPPAGWVKAVLAKRQVLLLAGDIGGRWDAEPNKQRLALAAAARMGNLAGARIACGRPVDFGIS